MKMNLEYHNGILTVYLIGILDRNTTYKIYNYLCRILAKNKILVVIFNLDELENITCDGIDALLKSIDIIHKYRGQAYLDKVNKKIYLKAKSLHIKFIKGE